MGKKYLFDENYFENIDTEEKAYWLGFLYADGYIQNDINACQFRVTLALQQNDADHIKKFAECLSSNHPIIDVHRKVKNKEYVAKQISIYSHKMVDDLYRAGCVQGKSLILKPPTLENDMVKHFIRGYFDGDGSIYYDIKRDRYVFSVLSTNDVLLWICKEIGVSAHIRNAKKDSLCKELRVNKKSDLIMIYNVIFKDANIYLQRKKDKADEMYQWAITNKYQKKYKEQSKTIIDLWNSGMKVTDIYNKTQIGKSTIWKCLKQATEEGLCFYNPVFESLHHKDGKPNISCSKKVYVYDNDEKYIGEYTSISELCRRSINDFGESFNVSCVSRVCLNQRSHYKNYIFSYVRLEKTERSETAAMADLLD